MGAVSHDRIVSDPAVMGGKPTVKGTRVTVELILEELADGMTVAEIREAHPHLTDEDVRAALGFAADYLRREEIIFGESAATAA
jgi:uncharacterized protein (DUF433 family)